MLAKDTFPTLIAIIALTAATFCLLTATATQSTATQGANFTVTINSTGTAVKIPLSCQSNNDCLQITANTTTAQITEGANCWKITNNTTKDIFIPTKTQEEFDSFRNNIPSAVATVTSCSGACGAGYVWDGTACVSTTVCAPSSPMIAAGDGSAGNPYQICNCTQLQSLPSNNSAPAGTGTTYKITQNIDCAATGTSTGLWTDGKGFIPIMNFDGILDGNTKNISNLFINRPSDSHVGLFGRLYGTVHDIGLQNISITGGQYTGGLAGTTSASITNSNASGTVRGNNKVGGLIGQAFASVTGSSAAGTVSGGDYAGGLAGVAGNSITNCYATATVSDSPYAGGLVGKQEATASITNSYATGTVTGSVDAGGLVGSSARNIENSYARGTVSGGSHVGGLVGKQESTGSILNAYAKGSATGGVFAGGLAGQIAGSIENAYAIGASYGTSYSGGLVGSIEATGSIKNSYATGKVTGDIWTGGLVGRQTTAGSITGSYWDKSAYGTTKASACFDVCTGVIAFAASKDAITTTKAPLTSWNFATIWSSAACNHPSLLTAGGTQNGPTVSEANTAFCGRYGKNCGVYTNLDNCLLIRTVNNVFPNTGCGLCVLPTSCGSGGTPNVCGCTPNCTGKVCGANNGCNTPCSNNCAAGWYPAPTNGSKKCSGVGGVCTDLGLTSTSQAGTPAGNAVCTGRDNKYGSMQSVGLITNPAWQPTAFWSCACFPSQAVCSQSAPIQSCYCQ